MAPPITTSKLHSLPNSIGKNFQTALNQSIEALSTSLHNLTSTDLESFMSEFREFVQSKADPPVESIWIYAALDFTRQNASELEISARVSAVKDLFQLIASCSASCHPVKSIVLLAPVVHNLHNLITVKGIQTGSKNGKKISREIKNLLDSVLSYANVCFHAFDGNVDSLEGFVRPLEDLISFWMADNVMQNGEESLRMFFPCLGDSIVKMVNGGELQMIDLAGFVATEALLLKLSWKIAEDGFGENLQNEIKSWVVGCLTGLQSSYVYGTFLTMLLTPVLPTSSIMQDAEYEDDLRKVLLDALMLVEYSFLSPKSLSQLPATHAMRIMLTKLIVTHEAIVLFRKRNDHKRHALYSTAFTSSTLPMLITKWMKTQFRAEFSIGEPKVLSPSSLLRWILDIESRGAKIFDSNMSKLLSSVNLKQDIEKLSFSAMEQGKKKKKKADSDLLFYVDNKGQEEDDLNEAEVKTEGNLSNAFMAAARSMQSSDKGGRKRKTERTKRKGKVKFVKYGVIENSLSKREVADEVRRNGSDVEDPSSDDDVE